MNNIDHRTEKRRLGDLGENIACDFLIRRGYEIIEKNYLEKWGEIDIVAKRGKIMHFVEVKSVRSYLQPVPHVTNRGVTHGTQSGYRPEDNMHPWKLKRLGRTIQTYLLHKKLDCDWQIDLITVKINMETRRAQVELIDNIV